MKIIAIIVLCIYINISNAQQVKIYLFPGQGSDARVFGGINFPDGYDTVNLSYPIPENKTSMKEFAISFIQYIDTTEPYILHGHSLGGMICSELAEVLHPEKVIIISSAKCRAELPFRYRIQKYIPINKIPPAWLIKIGALTLQPIVEPDRNKKKTTFKSMLKAKHPKYLKRTVNLIVNWDKAEANKSIIHIHGDNDHTIPHKNVQYKYLINNGSHMMVLTKAEEVNAILKELW